MKGVLKGVLSLLFALVITVVVAQIPNRYDGFSQGDVNSPVLFEAYMDLLCPASNAAWPTIKEVLNFYNPSGSASKLRFYMHLFPLPFHHNAFFVAQGLRLIDSESELTWQYVDLLFENQVSFQDAQTADNSANQVIQMVAALVEKSLNFSSQQFMNGMQNFTYNEAARNGYEYGCTRGVSGTPMFFINGFMIAADSSWSFDDWRQVIDPLLGNAPVRTTRSTCQRSRMTGPRDPPPCQPGQTQCQYLPGKYECCLSGENCIKGVGCRC